MTTADKNIVAMKLRRRHFPKAKTLSAQPLIDQTVKMSRAEADRLLVDDKTKNSSRFSATVAGILLLAVAVWGLIASVLS